MGMLNAVVHGCLATLVLRYLLVHCIIFTVPIEAVNPNLSVCMHITCVYVHVYVLHGCAIVDPLLALHKYVVLLHVQQRQQETGISKFH